MRYFVALELPAEVQATADGIARELKCGGADVKWVRPENLHVTLKFLGELEDGRTAELGRAVQAACAGCPPLELALAGAGAFPSPQRPQVIWLGLAGQVAELTGLAAKIDEALAALGFPPEEGQPFQAHVTLGRLRRGKGGRTGPHNPSLTRALLGLAAQEGPAFTTRRVTLMKSTLTPQGSIYDPGQVITLS